jgi:4-amino-4-deoxy-L-arabinose transferase-like glycosyltransferase
VTEQTQLRTRTAWLTRSAARVRVALVILLVLGFALRLIASEVIAGGLESPLIGDEPDYAQLATALAQGRGYVNEDGTPHSYRPPGVPFLISLAYRVAEPRIAVARVFMCAVAALLIPLCYLLGSSLGGTRAGLASALVAAIFPHWLYFSGSILSDLSTAALVGLTTWLLIEGSRRDSLPWFSAGGVAWGLAALTRPTCLAFGPALVLWMLLVMPTWRRRLLAALVTCVALAAVIAPWAVRSTLIHDRTVVASSLGGQAGVTFWLSNNPNATGILAKDYDYFKETGSKRFSPEDYPDPTDRANAYKADAIQFIRENPGRFARLCVVKLSELWKLYSPRVPLLASLATIASLGAALPFFLIQAVRRGWRRSPELLMCLLIASHSAVYMVFTAVARYRIPVEPLVLVMAAAGFFWSLDRLRSSASRGDKSMKAGGRLSPAPGGVR